MPSTTSARAASRAARLLTAAAVPPLAALAAPRVAHAQQSPRWDDDLAGYRPPDPPAPPRPRAPEPPAPAFGEAGEWVVTGASALGASWLQYDNSQSTESTFTFSPGVDWFVAPHLSIGLALDAESTDVRAYDALGAFFETKTTDVSIGARVGYDLPLGKYLSFYPRLTLGPFYDHVVQQVVQVSPTGEGPAPADAQVAGISGDVFAPLLLHPAPHFFLGFGPRVSHAWSPGQTGLAGLGDRTDVDGEVVVGGWWGGTAPEAPEGSEPLEAPPDAVPARFGYAGQVVLSNELGTTIAASTYTDRGGSSWSVSMTPAIDYFVVDHVALGLGATLSASGATAQEVDGVAYSSSGSSLALSPRIAFELPLGRAVSLLLRGWIGLEQGDNELKEDGADDKWSTVALWVGGEAPLLVHVATHFFVGFGPFVDRDVSRTDTYPNGTSAQIPSTRVGASLLVGGWL